MSISSIGKTSNLNLYGIAFSLEESSIIIDNSKFSDLSSIQGSAIYSLQSSYSQIQQSVTILNCSFINITASNGSAIYAQDTNAIIQKSYFSSNSANVSGGALYLACSKSNNRGCTFDVS